MRLNVILFTIVLGGLISGAVFFIFGYYFDAESVGQAQPQFGQSQTGAGQAFLLPVTETNYSPVRDFTIPEPLIEAKAAGLYDVKSGRFLYSRNINKRLPIASVTKLMTAVVILDTLNLDDIYIIPAEDINVDGSGADFYKGERLRGTDLFKIMLIKSSNDAALVFAAEAQKKGVDVVIKMNEKAQYLGMTNTRFSDPAGLNDDDAFSTVSDLVKLVRYAAGYDLIPKTLAMPAADVSSIDGRNHHLINTDQLLGQVPDIVLGKTGYTDNALGTMVLEVGLDGDSGNLVSVILGSSNRFGETKKLIEWAKKAYSWK